MSERGCGTRPLLQPHLLGGSRRSTGYLQKDTPSIGGEAVEQAVAAGAPQVFLAAASRAVR